MSSLDQLFLADTPLIDVRAPIEFKKGAFPTASNLPIMNDREREEVGICYKEQGSAAAESLGHELVSGDTRSTRIDAWIQFIDQNPTAQLYCFRGGQRSSIACDWLKSEGIDIPRISGGYKRLRNHLLDVFENLPRLLVVGGKTGTGKTVFLEALNNALDLEHIANHRGSAFGGHITPQPSQIDFENQVAIRILKLRDLPHVALEDEGRLIGRVHVPLPLQEKMKQSPLILIEENLADRTEHIYREYIEQQQNEYQENFDEEASDRYANYLLGALDAIRKRLGNVAHGEIRALMQHALQNHDEASHRQWISRLLTDYYDPMYNYQLSKKRERIRFCGTANEALEWYEDNMNRVHAE